MLAAAATTDITAGAGALLVVVVAFLIREVLRLRDRVSRIEGRLNGRD